MLKPSTKTIDFDNTFELVRTGCLNDTSYQSWGIVDECMKFTLVSIGV